MAIQYAPGSRVSVTYSTGGSTPAADIEAELIAQLPIAGFTFSAVRATDVLTFTVQPTDGQTVTLDSGGNQVVYTFKTAIAGANTILIDTTLAGSIANLMNAINLGPGSGTKYGAATVINPTMSATSTATTLTVTYKSGTSGSAGNQAPVGTSVTGATWATSTLTGGMNKFVSGITAQGNQGIFYIFSQAGSFYNPGSKLFSAMANGDGSHFVQLDLNDSIGPPANTQFHLIANQFQIFHFEIGATRPTTTPGGWFAFSVPYILTQNVANVTAIVLLQTTSTGGGSHWGTSSDSGNSWAININGAGGSTNNNKGGVDSLQFLLPIFEQQQASQGTDVDMLYYGAGGGGAGGSAVLIDAQVGAGPNSGNNPLLLAQLWDAAIIRHSAPLDTTVSMDSPAHTFYSVGSGVATPGYSLYIAVS